MQIKDVQEGVRTLDFLRRHKWMNPYKFFCAIEYYFFFVSSLSVVS